MCAGVGDKVIKDIRPGAPFEPTYIYRLLTLIKSSLSEKVTILLLESHTLHIYGEAMRHDDEFLILMITLFEHILPLEQTGLEGGVLVFKTNFSVQNFTTHMLCQLFQYLMKEIV